MTTENAPQADEIDYDAVARVEGRIDNLRNVADRFDHSGGSRRLAQRARDKADGMETALRLLGVTERGVFGDPQIHYLLTSPPAEGSGYCPDGCTWPHDHRFERDGVPWPARAVNPPGQETGR